MENEKFIQHTGVQKLKSLTKKEVRCQINNGKRRTLKQGCGWCVKI